MNETLTLTSKPLSGLNWNDWQEACEDIAGEDGYVTPLGEDHAAILIERKPILLVTFESFDTLKSSEHGCHPLGWSMVDALDWSHLCVLCNKCTWFRDPYVFNYFDRLIDDGFFDEFDQVIFYGSGACGYAAASFSVSAPGAKVLLLQPQATLDPTHTSWDQRFRHMRRTSFTDRFGYAPLMLEAADEAVLLFDPNIQEDAMHAALFNQPGVMQFQMRHMGPDLANGLQRLNILLRLLAQLSSGKLNRLRLARLFRARHKDPIYKQKIMAIARARQPDAQSTSLPPKVVGDDGKRPRSLLSRARIATVMRNSAQ